MTDSFNRDPLTRVDFFLSPPTGIIDPIYRRAPTPLRGYGNAREPTSHLVSPAGSTSPQTAPGIDPGSS